MYYEIDDDIIVLSKRGIYTYIQNYRIYLLKTDYDENADDLENEKQYVYTKNIAHLLNLSQIILRRNTGTARCVKNNSIEII